MRAIIAAILLIAFSASAKQTLPSHEVERIVDAIYLVEGGPKAKVPYGILSMKVRDKHHAREICRNTVRNTHARWVQAGARGNFLNFLADRYCPPSDSVGNSNWKKNIRAILAKKSTTKRAG